VSRAAKILFLVAFACLVVAFVMQFIFGMWVNLNSIALALAGVCAAGAILVDWKLYLEFFTMRTTKHGMNMGALILMALVTVVCVNFLASKHNKTFDFTEEKANSLSPQSVKVLAGLQNDIRIKVYYKGAKSKQGERMEEKKQKLRRLLDLYKDASGKVKGEFINGYSETELSMRDLANQPDRDTSPVIALVEYGDKKKRVDEPFEESSLTSAIIKATRQGENKIYFVKGHGEKDLQSEEDPGLKEFARSLDEASFKVEILDLMEKKEVPADADVVAIIGPTVPYLDGELKALREYAEKGGKLFVAMDPGERHNLANLVKPLGVEFENNYVVMEAGQSAIATVLARTFDPMDEITKNIQSGGGYAVFHLASEVRPAPDKPAGLQVTEIVKSAKAAYTVNDFTHNPPQRPELKERNIGVDVHGKLGSAADAKPFEAVIFGDSDFLSNRILPAGMNRDLAMNVVAALTNQKDLISIGPKNPKGNVLVLTGIQQLISLISVLAIPTLLLLTAIVIWFRRRAA
jgi:ABC-type uncharacterized transport system involved in gliding motility auxiliary subunit